MTNIKLIVSDIDGTLVDSSEKIPQELVNVVGKCKERGIVFALATGRTTELAAPFVSALHIDAPCIEANGAYILQGEKCLLEHGFSVEPVKEVLYKANEQGMTVTLADTHSERAMKETEYVRYHQKMGDRFKELLPFESISWGTDRFQKVMIMDESRSGKIVDIRKMLEPYSNDYWITTFSDKAVELGPKNCNKATGVKDLAELLGIDMKDVMACGDYRNDFEMIRNAGFGVAVANALPELKTLAKYVAEKPYALGVVEAIERFCLADESV